MKTSTKSKPRTARKADGKSQKKMSAKQPDGEIQDSFQVLKGHLNKLEKEQKAIRAELTKKRKARAEKLQKLRETREQSAVSLKRLETGIEESLTQTKKQKKYLKAMRQVQRQNEQSLDKIARKLDGLEVRMSEGNLSVSQLKTELLGMLGDLQKIRQRREKAENLFNSP